VVSSIFPPERYAVPAGIGCAGIALAWAVKDASGLLVAVAAICTYGGRRISQLSTAAFAIAAAALPVLLGWTGLLEPAVNLRLATFLAVGAGISAVILLHQGGPLSGHEKPEPRWLALQESEQQLRVLVDTIPALVWCTTPEGKPSYINKRLTDYVGVTLQELIAPDGSRSLADVHSEDRASVEKALAHSIQTGAPFRMKYRQRRSDGTLHWTEGRAEPLRNSDGTIVQWYGVCLDIEDLVVAQEALHDRERELSLLVDMVPSHVWRLTSEGEPTFFNKRMVDFLGLNVDDTDKPGISRLTAMISAALHPDDATAFRDALTRCLSTGRVFAMRYRLRRVDGTYRWMSGRAEPMRDHAGRILHWYGLCHDIDDQVHAEEELRNSERRYRDLFHYMPIGLAQIDAQKIIPLFKELRAQGVTELKDHIDEHPEFLLRAVEALEVEEVNQHIIEMFGAKNAAEMHGPITRYWLPSMETIRRSIEARYRGEEVFREECKVARVDGSVIDVLFTTARPGAVSNKSLVGFIDITERKKAEDVLRQREHQLQVLVDAIPAFIWCLTPEGTPSYFNKRVTDQIGLTISDLTAPDGSLRLESVHPEDRPTVQRALIHSLATGEPFALKYRQRRGYAHYRWTEGRAEALRDESGQIVQWYGVYLDIDDEVVAQQVLRERERELSQLVDMVPSLLWRLNPDGEPIFFNKRMIDFLGMDVTDTDTADSGRLAAVIQAVIHPDDVPSVAAALNRSIGTGEPFAMTYRVRRADGVYRWMSGRAEPMRDEQGRIAQWYGLSHDIDDQVRAEEELRASKRQLEQMIDAVPINILSFAPSGRLIYASKRYMDTVGSPPSHIEDFDALARDIAHPEDFPAMFRNASTGFATGQPFVNRFRRREKNGAYRWIEARAHPLRDASGTIVQWYIASIDIEDEMRAQEALRERERTLRQLVETLPAMIDCAAPNGEPIYRSRQLREFLGYEFEALDSEGKSRLQGTLEASVHPDDLAGVRENYARSLSTGEPYARRHRLRRCDGEYRWVETRAAPMRGSENAIVQWNVICLDIDGEVRAQIELRSAQEKMARASQAASLAELSASIAHEVNQPLAAIVATSYACRRWLSADPPNLERAGITLDRIIRDANSASDVVSRIRALFSQSGKSRTQVDMAEMIREVCLILADDLAAKNTQVETVFSPILPRPLVDRVQMQQVLVNLIRNAIDSMEGIVDRPRLIRIRAFPDGTESVRFELQDHGCGIIEHERVFDPFFTTKQNGMGMGLAICRSIIESHNGRLWIPSSGQEGTTLAFTLPTETRASA